METTYEEIYDAHLPNVRLGNVNKPVLIIFSAIPGSGKSELTKRLVDTHGISGIANKDIRKSLEQTGHTEDVIIGDYTLWLLDKLIEQGPIAIVFDRNIDQWYEPIKIWSDENGYRLVVVRIEVSRNKLEKRLHNREGDNVGKVLEVLDFYSRQHEHVKPSLYADILLTDDYDLDAAAQMIADNLEEPRFN